MSKSSRMVGTALSSYIVFFVVFHYSMLYPQGIPTMGGTLGVISSYLSLHPYPQRGYGHIAG